MHGVGEGAHMVGSLEEYKGDCAVLALVQATLELLPLLLPDGGQSQCVLCNLGLSQS